MFFEGSEKKFEVVFSDKVNLLDIEKAFWEKIVKKANADILSEISNGQAKAYLLSESSLFVFKQRVIMITCGQTTLVNSLLSLINEISKNNIELLIFQRKNEYFSHIQQTNFLQDVKSLKNEIEGRAFRFGRLDSHHNLLFHMDKPYKTEEDITTELLMYEISPDSSDFLTTPNLTTSQIRTYFNIDQLLQDFIINDFSFTPCGYSLNAIKDETYITLHITPQKESSYVSVETNLEIKDGSNYILEKLLNMLAPRSFDIVSFDHQQNLKLNEKYRVKDRYIEQLSSGLNVSFEHYFHETNCVQRALEFTEDFANEL